MFDFFEKIKSARKAAHMTQQDVAAAVGITREQYNRIERGKDTAPVKTLRKIAAAIGCELVVELRPKTDPNG